jgi:hypothetical protein
LKIAPMEIGAMKIQALLYEKLTTIFEPTIME